MSAAARPHEAAAAHRAETILAGWSGFWSPYTLVDRDGVRRRLWKARIEFADSAGAGEVLSLCDASGDALDREPIPPGTKGVWHHGFWIPSAAVVAPEGDARRRWHVEWSRGAEVLARSAVAIAKPDPIADVPLRLDRLGAHLRTRLESRPSEAGEVGPGGEWRAASSPAHVAQHDLIYERPSPEWDEGLPVGNGDVGALICGEAGRRMTVYLDKCDIWFATDTELPTGRGHAGALRVAYRGPGAPFHQRLALTYGEVVTEDGALRFVARVHAQRNCFELAIEGPAGQELDLALERGAVPLPRSNPGAAAILNGSWRRVSAEQRQEEARRVVATAPRTSVAWGARGREMWYVHQAPNVAVAAVVRVEAAPGDARILDGATGGAAAGVRIPESGRMRILAAVSTSREADDPLAHARGTLDACHAEADGTAHRDWWERFWSRSWIDLPDKLEENLWYLGLYNQACVSRGPQAVGFFGLWQPLDHRGWRDCYVADAQVPMMWWSCFATNHLALLFPSHHTFGSLAVECVEHTPGAGMVVPHQFDPVWAGGHRTFTGTNPYKGSTAWYVLNFWWDYLYAGDRRLLEDLTYPLLRMAADHHAADLVMESDGRLHCLGSGAPEQGGTGRDNVYDWALLTGLFRAALGAAEVLGVDPERRAHWRATLERLFAAPGDGDRLGESRDVAQPYRCHPVVMMGVYPTGAIAYGSEEWAALRRTLPVVTNLFGFRFHDRHEPHLPGHEGGVEPNAFSSGMLAIAYARLGDREQYRRGFYGLIVRCHMKRNGLRALNDPRQADVICRSPLVEAANAHTTATTETLLQSWSDHIRLFPCVDPVGTYRFAGLRTFGGFCVSAQLRDGVLTDAEFSSLAGEPLALAWPWDTAGVSAEACRGASAEPVEVRWSVAAGERRLHLDTAAGTVYRLRTAHSAPVSRSAPEQRERPRRIAVDRVDPPVVVREAGPPAAAHAERAPTSATGGEAVHTPLVFYPEDPPFGQVLEDCYLYLGNPAGPDDPLALAPLTELARAAVHPDWAVRQHAARALGRAGREGAPAIRLLVALAGDAVSVVAHTAAVSLVRLGSRQSLAEARRLATHGGVPGLRREVEKAMLRWHGSSL